MRLTLKKTLTALVSLSLVPLSALATIVAPHEGTAITVSANGTPHNALDIASGKTCGSVPVDAPIQGSATWNVTLRTTGKVCAGSGSGNSNEAKHTFSNGYTLRVWHFLKTSSSVSRTCDRCELGDEGSTGSTNGPRTHLQLDKSGTATSSWFSRVSNGEFLKRGEVISP